MKKIATSMLLLSLAATVAGAQMRGGGRGMPGHTPGGGTTPGAGFGTFMPGGGTGGTMADMFGSRGAMASGSLVVTSQGTVIATRAVDSDLDGVYEGELVAVTPAGTEAWKKSLAGLGFLLGVSNDVILAVQARTGPDPTTPFAGTVVALDIANGAERWRLDVDGMPTSAEPFAGGTYLTVVNRSLNAAPAPGTRMGGLMTVALWKIDQAGNVGWKYDLSQ